MAEATCLKVVGAVVVVVITLVVALVTVSLKKLSSDEIGLQYDVINRKLSSDPSYEGLHNGPPGFQFVIFPSVFRSLDFTSIRCLNKDGVEINLSIGFQYRVRPNDLLYVIMQFRDHDEFREVITTIGESAIHDACSKYNTSQFQSERGAFQEDVRKRLTAKLDRVDTDITDLQVSNIARPGRYESAVTRKESAREDITVAVNERPQKLTEAMTGKLQSETQARIALDKAESDARIKKSRADAEAAAILDEYTKEAESYKELRSASGLNLDINGFLSYLAVRTIEDAKQTMHINMDPPAKTNWLTT